ncbi:unnamed protein product [Clavelina lepadiformis]|uniref:IC97/Casc1 N-terminal domain-containing protein n=1 Tax=Clavelina lepadiformis TaxID=159417 RepID=A0ABP0EXH8_CLALP
MPPKSPQTRSGKSTPTRGKPKEDEKLVDEEEEKLRVEQEEKERREKEAKMKLEEKRISALRAIRDQQESETEQELRIVHATVEKVINDRRANAEWKRFMKCDGRPDPTSVKEINTFIALTKDKGKKDINVVLDDAKLILSLIRELKFILKDADSDEETETTANHKQTILSLQDLLITQYNEATLKLLKEASYEADSETGNLQKVIKDANETLMLWGNLNKNPRFKAFEFESEKFQFELPKVLAMADIAVRVLKTRFDHYSHQCSTCLPQKKKTEVAAVEEQTGKEPITEKEEVPKVDAGENKEVDDTKSTTTDGRKSAMSAVSNKEEKEGGEENAEDKPDRDEHAATPEIKVESEHVELEEILDPDVVDLRQFTPLGGVYHLDLLQMPPQPKVVRGWTLTQIINKPLTNVTYPVDIVAGKTPSRAASAAPEGREEGSSPSKTSHEQPPIGITMSLPDDVMFFEEPQVAMWDHTDKHWKNTTVPDSTTYDEEKRVISFKTNEFGVFCLMQDTHLNMPFQSWELRPKGTDAVVLTVTAAIAEAEIEIKGTKCRLNPPEEDSPKELSHIFDKWMSVDELIQGMRAAGVNLFPASDSRKFVSIQEKTVDVDQVYDQMAILSTAFAFQWSKWNSDIIKSRIAIQAAPFYVADDSSRASVPDDDWSTYLIGDDRTYKLALTEFDNDFSDEIASGSFYHYDLMHAMRLSPVRDDPDGKILASLNQRSRSANRFYVDTVQTLLRASKIISFS